MEKNSIKKREIEIDKRLIDSRNYYIWGTGVRAKQINEYFANHLKRIKLIGYIDNDSSKWEGEFYGKKIYSPEVLKENKESYIIIANMFSDEITNQIIKSYPWYRDRIADTLFFERQQVISRYKDCKENEIQDIVNYLVDHPLQVFNYPFVEKYDNEDFDIKYDKEKKLFYTLYYNKKMYFSRSFHDEEKVREYYKSICLEQDFHSPHKYLTDIFEVPNNAVVVDAGVAEGNFALSIVECAKKIYLFEPDKEWVEALKYTFEPYNEKVVIVNKSLSNYIDDNTTTIDETLNGSSVDFIKMDIEGEEYYAIQGAIKSIEISEDVKCVVCTYHQEFAYSKIKTLLEDLYFKIETSTGYMWYPENFNVMRAPVLRRGVIRAEKKRL
ncbi:FkbM family methyltransferase [Lacrimispora sp.]|uniref:FkbM family methyltransferase n=1 Tax=Lacrimispora sp. TaxID=2719234 RepID=UPI0028A17653|nr:FkbM family methyltransferase [Lacrimispora sp.]